MFHPGFLFQNESENLGEIPKGKDSKRYIDKGRGCESYLLVIARPTSLRQVSGKKRRIEVRSRQPECQRFRKPLARLTIEGGNPCTSEMENGACQKAAS